MWSQTTAKGCNKETRHGNWNVKQVIMTTVNRMLLTEEQRWQYISIAKMQFLICLQLIIFLVQSVCGTVVNAVYLVKAGKRCAREEER